MGTSASAVSSSYLKICSWGAPPTGTGMQHSPGQPEGHLARLPISLNSPQGPIENTSKKHHGTRPLKPRCAQQGGTRAATRKFISPPVSAVSRVVPLIAMACALVGPWALPSLVSIVMTFLLVFSRTVCPLSWPASGTRGAPATRLVRLLGEVLAVLCFPGGPHFRAFVGSTPVHLPWRRVTAAPRTTLWLGPTWGRATITLPSLRRSRPGRGSWVALFTAPALTATLVPFGQAIHRAICLGFLWALHFPFGVLHRDWGRLVSFTFFGGFYWTHLGSRWEACSAVQNWSTPW